MAEVFGRIGNEEVELNNAATEATLRALLQSSLSANKQTIESISKIATKAGLDPETVQKTNVNISRLGAASFTLGAAYGGLTNATESLRRGFSGVDDVLTELTSGSAEASRVLSIMGKIGGPLGLVLDGMARLAAFQENTLSAYQSMTNAGVNFGGSLTQLRLAASQSYLTLNEFTALMRANGPAFAMMGDNANQGAVAFSKVTKTLISSELGDNLRALGYTFNDLNQGALNYITATGGRTRAELTSAAGMAALTAGTAAYLEQVDRLTQITGKSREEQEAELKRLSMQAAWENYIAKLRLTDPKAADRALAGLAEASARGGKRMAENFQAMSMGLPPITEANARYAGILQQGHAALGDLVQTTKDGSKSLNDVAKAGAGLSYGLVQDRQRIGDTATAISMQDKENAEAVNTALKAETKAINQNVKTLDDHRKQVVEVTDAQRKQKASEADAAAQTQKAVNELGQEIMQKLMPVVASLMSGFNKMLTGVISMVEWILKTPTVFNALIGITGLVTAGFIALKVAQAKYAAEELLRTKGRTLGTPGAPMHVLVTNPRGGPAGGVEVPETGGPEEKDKGKKGGKAGKIGKALKGFGIGTVVGIGADMAADSLGRETAAGASADVVSSAAGMAGTGAMIGSLFGGVGAVPGAAIGGVLGTGYGLYQNWGKLFGESKTTQVPKLEKPPEESVAASNKRATEPVSTPAVDTAMIETLHTELQTLNKQSAEMLKYMKETTDYSRRTLDATSALSGNLFKR